MKNLTKILITGGAGYCGGILVPLLLKKNYFIRVYDIMFFGSDHLQSHPNLEIIKADIRNIEQFKKSLKDIDIVLHLACISNDTSFVLNEKLSESINYDAFEPLVLESKKSDQLNVTEDHPLVPLTLYNKFKGLCEPLLFKHIDENFTGVVFRPATVCGYSPRQRLDVSVNILTNFAINKNFIKVFGGEQMRPNLHINDYAKLCIRLIECEKNLVNGQIFNCGYENMKINEIADTVKIIVEKNYNKKINIETEFSDDNRSYHINSDKIKKILNFIPTLSVEDAVNDLCKAFKKNLLPNSFDDDKYFNVKSIKNSNMV